MVELIHTHKGTVYAQRNGVLIPVNTDGLVGYWPMTQGSGSTAYDESKTGNDGTIYGASWTSTANGKALDFDGVDDYVEVAQNNSLSLDTFTLIAWAKGGNHQDSSWGTIIGAINGSWTSGVDLRHWSDTEELQYDMRESDGSSQINLIVGFTKNKWHCVGIKRDGSNIYMYLDGKEQGPWTPTWVTNDGKIWIGRNRPGVRYEFNGNIDEVRIYDRTLSTQEITNIYEKTRGLYSV